METLFVLLFLFGLAIDCYVINLFIGAAEAKGYQNTQVLWFVGLAATPIILALYIIAMPNKKKVEEA